MSNKTTADLLAVGKNYYVPVYKPRETILERGAGARVWDREG
ncbi:MAG: aspartate aminotransferase family protein, partial [Gammaproteobacteria bacterium]